MLAALAEDPASAAVLLDVDGTLAPIAARPELARVPDATRAELARLVGRYALVACISGRTSGDAEALVGVDGIRYVGVHGLELAPEADRWRGPLREFAASVDWPVEDKGLAVVFHYREADDADATDVDAFGGLDGLELAVRVAVASAEGPPELREAADIVVGGPDELLDMLR